MDIDKQYSEDHVVYKNDPVMLKGLLNKQIRVNLKRSVSMEGTVYAIDPVSETIALLTDKDNEINLDLVMGCQIATIDVVGESGLRLPDNFFGNEEEKQVTEDELANQRRLLMSWLETNMLPVSEDGDLIRVGKVLTIHPPYKCNNCISESEIILERIQKVIDSLPSNT